MTSPRKPNTGSGQGKNPLKRMQFNVPRGATKEQMVEALTEGIMKAITGQEKPTKPE
jgi:hypothetical protein